ncbi:MAG TPA: GAF domain-containing protein [Candidatus Limnocylindria bacterium]
MAVLVLAPNIPNLGAPIIWLLAGSLVVSAAVLHVLATRMRTAGQVERLSWIVLGWDIFIVALAQLAMTPDPLWPAIVLIGVLLVVSSAFRLGEIGALISASAEIVVVVLLTFWRQDALAIGTPVAYLGFDVVMFCLAAILMTSMLREVGTLRQERHALLSQVGDVETLRRSTEQHARLLEHEREARTAAELTITRLEAVRQITDAILRQSSIDDVLAETLAGVARIAGAHAVVVLGVAGEQGVSVRAAYGLEHSVRRPLPLEGDLGEAVTADKPVIVSDNSTTPLDAHATERIDSRILLPLHGAGGAKSLLYIGFTRHQDFGRDDLTLLGLIAERVGIALERVERFEAERRAREAAENVAERSRLFLDAADTLLRAPDASDALVRLARLAVPRLGDWCAVYALRADTELECVALASEDGDREARLRSALLGRIMRPSHHPLWSVIRSRQHRLIERIGPEDLVPLAESSEHLRVLLEASIRSWLAVPLLADGRLLGVFELYATSSGRAFTTHDVESTRGFAEHVAVALARAGAIR